MDDSEAHLALENLNWVDTLGRYFYHETDQVIKAIYEVQ